MTWLGTHTHVVINDLAWDRHKHVVINDLAWDRHKHVVINDLAWDTQTCCYKCPGLG